MKIDLSLNNTTLYAGCAITETAGRQNLTTQVPEAVELVGKNAKAMVAEVPVEKRGSVLLTGPMAVWSYLVVFHQVVHSFQCVYYSDGRSVPVLIAAHGAVVPPPQ